MRPSPPIQESHRLRKAIRLPWIASALAFTLTCFVLSLPRYASAQASAGITGTVTDPTGAVVANARVDIVNDATSASDHTVTSSAGTYSFKGLLPGKYSVTVDATGFKKAVQKGVTVEVSTNSAIDFSLTTGGTIQGRVIPVSGPMSQIPRIALYAAADTTKEICENDLADTSFGFFGLDDGNYFLKLFAGAAGSWYPGSSGAAGADTLRVQNLTGPPPVIWNYR